MGVSRLTEVMDSSNIRRIGYDYEEKKLIVEFMSGRIYRYRNVPPATYGQLCAGESVGAVFNNFVRDKFETTELTAELT